MKLLSFLQPDRPDERARIEAAGGRVLVVDGARVEGILATSRAIGIHISQFADYGKKMILKLLELKLAWN